MENMSLNLAETTIKMLGDRWKVQIIECLMDGTKRFGELKRELGNITQKVLTSNLRMLEEKRSAALNEIHFKEHQLQRLDYLRHEIRRSHRRTGGIEA